MAELNFEPGTIFHMDNLDALRGMNSETVDLIATDPPFNTGGNRERVGGKYVDQWRWGDNVHQIWMDQIRDDNRPLVEAIEGAMHAHSKNLGAFLCFLGVRLIEMKRILKKSGSVYLHCDHTAGHYIKTCMDAVFGAGNFRNEIAWHYQAGTKGKWNFGRKHDTIFLYSKSYGDHIHNRISKPSINPGNYDQVDNDGRRFLVNGQGRKYYLDEGQTCDDVWTYVHEPEFNKLHSMSKERTGYPDQKPIALYERMIKASTNEGDLVVDPFCGTGTTIHAARRLGRQWVGIDRNDDAKDMILCSFAGIKKLDLDKIREETKDTDPGYVDRTLGHYETLFTTIPPTRSDDQEEIVPELPPVYLVKDRSVLEHSTMKEILFNKFGPHCWGCNFVAPDGDRGIRYLELDHINPKSDGGSDHLDNRALLCGPCNKDKRDELTLGALRRKILGGRKAANSHPIDLVEAADWSREKLRIVKESKQ